MPQKIISLQLWPYR